MYAQTSSTWLRLNWDCNVNYDETEHLLLNIYSKRFCITDGFGRIVLI
jgi:hypothetical protein